jgi:hypothetical protein
MGYHRQDSSHRRALLDQVNVVRRRRMLADLRGVIRRNSNLAFANRFSCPDKVFKPPGTRADSSLGEPLQES